ncbi:putative mediator of RNA polymerase II transcription subunit 26 [Ruditapes philippinarum]|uniref:putative mediator of RNA polymerase II transcription subunit 26 n=1 Tax=Ruditapes philippinarum TaxID=129788 RepID=UPI00295AB35F|nr:putative mediator of RNA polymerase II transcription subunit 26 [Ruditapes philippinarum]
MKMEYNIRKPWTRTTLYLLVLFASFSSGFHLGTVNQKRNGNSKLLNKQVDVAKIRELGDGKNPLDNLSLTKNVSDISQTSIRKLQLEIQELLRMQKQLQSEMVSGADNAKKTKLLQHIKTQIQLRMMQQKGSKSQHTASKNVHSKADFTDQQKGNSNQHKTKPNKTSNVAVKQSKHVQLQQPHIPTHNNAALQNVQYQKQNEQIQQLKQQKQELTQRSQYTVQSKRKQIIPMQTLIQQSKPTVIEAAQNPQMPYANLDLAYNNLELQNQQQLQMQQISPTAFIQQRVPIQINNQNGMNQAQVNLMDRQFMGMNQNGVKLESSQHVLVPVNALSVNSLVPRNLLTGERYIVVDTAMQDNLNLKMADGSLVIQSDKQKLTEKPTTQKPSTTKASTQAQQITKPITQRPTTTLSPTVATKPPSTLAPTPPTTRYPLH